MYEEKNIEEFCDICRKTVPVTFETEDSETRIKGIAVKYKSMKAICSCCHNEVWSRESHNYNIYEPTRAYCRIKGLILPEQITELTEKYDIGINSLSAVLGWSEATIGRFLNGFIPSKSYSNKLLDLLNDERVFYSTVEKNWDKLTPVAQKKIMAKKETLMHDEPTIGVLSVRFDIQNSKGTVTLTPSSNESYAMEFPESISINESTGRKYRETKNVRKKRTDDAEDILLRQRRF